MPLPDFNSQGDLPPGVYQATLDEVLLRFGGGTAQRQAVTARLLQIWQLANTTGRTDRLVLFGSYITAKPDPNDIDILLVMRDDFDIQGCDEPTRGLLDHTQAAERFGASVFWIRPALLLLETLEEFITHWQIKRDGTRRGIVVLRA